MHDRRGVVSRGRGEDALHRWRNGADSRHQRAGARLLCGAPVSIMFAGLLLAADGPSSDTEPSARQAPATDTVSLGDPMITAQLIPVPADTTIHRHYLAPGGVEVRFEDPPGTVVYSNTGGTALLSPGDRRRIADDLFVTAVGGCDLSAYEILVSGGGDGTGGDGFTVETRLYDACPGAGGVIIPGTERSITFEDDGLHLVTIDLSDVEILIGASVWISVRFSTDEAGWLVGSRAEIGLTEDLYDYPHPALRCQARLGGTSLYAGFYAKLYCAGDVETQYVAYLNTGMEDSYPGDAHVTVLDDIELMVDECVLSGYEVGLVGEDSFQADVELWFDCDESTAIPGTAGTFQGVGSGSVEVARFSFEEGVPLPSSRFWVAITPSNDETGPALSGEASIGSSEDVFGIWTPPNTCEVLWFGGNPYAAFWVTVYCLGAPPMGACCKVSSVPGQPPCRESPLLGCEGGRWIKEAVCDPDPFIPPCGTHACCLADSSCTEVTEAGCEEREGVWHRGHFCKIDPGVDCPFTACERGEGNCCEARTSTGCGLASCCEIVCEDDGWCCLQEWDRVCADEARRLCGSPCIAGEVTWIDPPNGVVDARQPHGVDDATEDLGIDAITVAAPSTGADACCWTLCETDFGRRAPNTIMNVTQDAEAGTYTIHLSRPITPGALTGLTYEGGEAAATFISHPGNVNGDIEAGSWDVLCVIGCLQGFEDSCPWGLYSCDADGDGACGPSDILRVIDLLNGAGQFASWNETELPKPSDVCPEAR